jgi:hypothetical protein
MKTLSKVFATIAAASALTVATASPALADHGRGGVGGWRGGDDNPHMAIGRCSRAAEREAGRAVRGFANVTEVRDVRETRFGYEVRGRIAVKSHGGLHRSNWNDGWSGRGKRFDSGSFKCRVERGRIVDLDLNGINRY